MEQPNLYIGLGSNLGDRLGFLQTAIDLIFDRIGPITAISSLYETPSLGFEGPQFLNACCGILTNLEPYQVLRHLALIEAELGRVSKSHHEYTSRVIDLDILFYEDHIVSSSELVLPHPRIHERRFVLEPMNEVAPKLMHPLLKESIGDLLAQCKDESEISKLTITLKHPRSRYSFNKINYLSLEGNIGSGKTSLAQMIAKEYNGRLVLERFADNPFLPKFYKDPDRYAFTLEMSFLADRYHQITDDLAQLNLFKDFVVSDYYVYKSLIFSKITLPAEEFKLYRTLFYQMYKDLPQPDLYIYLYQNTERLKDNIKKRGRVYEQDISEDYLDSIQKGYLDFLKKQPELRVRIIDITHKDFVQNRGDLIWILNQIEEAYRG